MSKQDQKVEVENQNMHKQNSEVIKTKYGHFHRNWAYYFFILFEIAIILIYAFCIDYADYATPRKAGENTSIANEKLTHSYPLFQDVHVMIFIGFGFLMTFLKNYSWSAVGLNFILGAWVVQISIILNALWFMIAKNEWGKIKINIHSLIDADFTAGSILIAFGGVLGKLNFIQYLVMATIQAFFYSLAYGIGAARLGAVDVGGSMYIHTFGAYFGLSVSLALKGRIKDFSKYGSNYTSNLFSFIGTIFLWIYWPSFNAAPTEGSAQIRAVVNTYLSLTGSCIMVFLLSPFLKDGKLHAEYILNATLAGGVMIGNSADLIVQPWAAILIGCSAGVLSILGFHYINNFLHEKIGLHDSCGIHYLHGMTGFMGGIIGAIFAGTANEVELGDSLLILYPNRKTISANMQGCYQLAALAIVLGVSIVSGLLTGFFLRCSIFTDMQAAFDDREKWEVEDEEVDNFVVNGNELEKKSSAVYEKGLNNEQEKGYRYVPQQTDGKSGREYDKIVTNRSEGQNVEMNDVQERNKIGDNRV